MATHDYNIANQTGADFRADLNNALLAIVSNNSNATSPSTTYAYQLWVDTSSNVLKLRNSANSDWITTGISITASNSFTGDITGNSATATALATARTINGVSFDGTANISFNSDSVSEGSSNLYFTNERVDDQVNSLLTAGSGISLTYDDAAGTLTIANTNSADITSVVAGDGLTGGGTSGDVTLAVSVDDSSIEINSDTLRVKASGITNAMLAGSIANDKLAGSIANSKLANSSVTINSQAISLGGSHTFDSDDIGEGSSNLYFTNARARGSLSIGSEGSASGNGAIAYNSSTGVFTYTPPVISGLSGDTDDLSEGSSNLYYTDARSNAAIDARVTNTFINNLSGVVADTATALATARSIALSGDVTASGVNFDGTGDITLSTTIAANSVALGTDTTGNYVAGISGTTNEIEVSGSGSETASVTIGLPDNVTIAGNLTVNGTTTTVNTATLEVEDPLIKLAKANSGADSVDIGFYGLYDTSGSQDLYAGLFRDASDSGKFKLFKDLQAEPTTTVNTSGTGYAVGTLVSNLEGDVTGNVTGNVSGTAATVTGAAQTNITSLGTLTGLTTTGDINLGDDDKVIFGAGSDLQISHNGAASLIQDTGTGDLLIRGTNLKLQNASGENYLVATSDDATRLYFDNAERFSTLANGNRLDAAGGNFNTTASTTVGISAQIKNSSQSSNNNGDYKGAIGFTTGNSNNVRSAIAAKQTQSSANRQGLAFLVHPDTTVGTLSEALVLNHDSSATFGAGVDVTGTLTATTLAGTLSTAAQPNITSLGTLSTLTVDDITINGSTISDAANLTIDIGGELNIDVDGGAINYKDGGTHFGSIEKDGNNFRFESKISDGDIVFRGNDGGSGINALTLDMSNAGSATFNKDIFIGDGNPIRFGDDQDGRVFYDDTNGFIIQNATSDKDILIKGNDGGSEVTALTLDMSNAGRATFNENVTVGGNLEVSGADVTITGNVIHAGDTDTFFGFVTDNQWRFVGGSAEVLRLYQIAGSTGVVQVAGAGSATYPNFTFNGDTNTGMFSSGADTLQFTTGGSEALRVDSSQNVGIGTASPSNILHLRSATPQIYIQSDDGNDASIVFGDASDASRGQIKYTSSDEMVFLNNNLSERFRIDASGNLGLGTTSPSSTVDSHGAKGTTAGIPSGIINATDTTALAAGNGGAINFSGCYQTGGAKTAYASIEASKETATHNEYGAALVFKTREDQGTQNEHMRLTSTGNVGLGITNPSQILNLKANTPFIQFNQDGTDSFAGINFGDDDDANDGQILYDHDSRYMRFQVANNERLRIDASGNVLINTTSNQGVGGYTFEKAGSGIVTHNNNNGASGGYEFSIFRRSSVQIGSIAQNGTTGIQLNTSSDARLKDVTGSARGLDVINNLNPVAYNWKADNRADEGLIAQEVEKVMPNAVSQTKDGYYMMDYSKLVTPLIKAVQEQQEQIESLKSEIANLKGE